MKNCEIFPEETAIVKVTYGVNQPYNVVYLSVKGADYLWNYGQKQSKCKHAVTSNLMFWKNERI